MRPDRRGQGIGRSLLRQVIDLARELPGVKKVVLSVAPSGEPAIRLYTAAGFRRAAEDEAVLHMVLDVVND